MKKGTKVAIFGKGQIDYVKGGGGSGDVTCAYVRNIYQGLKIKHSKVEMFESLDYDNGVVTTEPTCEGRGVKTFTCKNDSKHTYTEDIDAKGHDFYDITEEGFSILCSSRLQS